MALKSFKMIQESGKGDLKKKTTKKKQEMKIRISEIVLN